VDFQLDCPICLFITDLPGDHQDVALPASALRAQALWDCTLVGEDTALSCYHPGPQDPLPSGTAPLLLHPDTGCGDTMKTCVSKSLIMLSILLALQGCGQQVFLTVFGKSERLNVDRVGADETLGKGIWSLQYHHRLNQWGIVFQASIFHLLCVLVLGCNNILIVLLQTLASNLTSAQ